jgi:pimeloyl-ACP methyl ester carboxylesterase
VPPALVGVPYDHERLMNSSGPASRRPPVAWRSAPARSHLTIAVLSTLVIAAVACGSASPSQQVSFPTADGGTVVADFYAANGPDALVLAHGAAFDKGSWASFATWLASRGHQVLAINFRGYGRSTAGRDSQALFEDVLGAVRYLHAHGVTRVAVLGASMGGGVAAEADVRAAPGEIDRVILLSPLPIADPEKLRGPVLFIASQDEAMVTQVAEQYRHAPEPKQFILLRGTAHGQHIFATDQAERLRTTVAEFLEQRSTP